MNILQLGPSQRCMASTLDIGNLMWAIGILLLPLILAVPAKILYQTVILGVGPAERNYRSTVQKILDSGMQVEQFREVLDEEARRLGLKASRAKLNETDMLYPLSLTLLASTNDIHSPNNCCSFTTDYCHGNSGSVHSRSFTN